MKKLFHKLILTISLLWGLYFLWTKIYRFVWQRKYSGDVKPKNTMNEVLFEAKQKLWKKDTWRELGDAISYPRYFEEVGDKGKLGNDCDDFSIWMLNASKNGVCHNDKVYIPLGLLTVTWREGWSIKGHNVALFYCIGDGTRKYSHASNWGFYRLDLLTVEEIAMQISRVASKELAGWRLSSPDLKERLDYKIY